MDRCLDRDLWRLVVRCVRRAARQVKSAGRTPRYSDELIVTMYLWSVWNDRPLSWACHREHYGTLLRPRKLPSVSQFTRRVKTDACRQVLQLVHRELAGAGVGESLSYLDAKPLTVSPVSKDPDAKRGRVSGGFAKGYKLHAYMNGRRVGLWCVAPLNADEKLVAAQVLLPNLPPPADPHALTLADSAYDAAPLYKGFAAAGHTLLAPVRGQKFVGPRGRLPKTLRQMGPQRRAALSVWERHPDLARYVAEQRNNAEGTFSVLAVALGLHALPPFVRRMKRVRRWVGAKIILYHARLLAQEAAAKKAAA